jgi:putative hydrolase of the HAD superfamily
MIPAGITTWVFDLDNTLYPAPILYDEIGERMTTYIARTLGVETDAALELRERYFHEYGASIVGLVRHHAIDAADFLRDVHDADHSVLMIDPELRSLIEALPGRRIIHTNGGGGHAERVLASLGLGDLFDAVFDIESAALTPKPLRESYERLVQTCGFNPRAAVLIEDSLRNLPEAHAMGFTTALIGAEVREPRPLFVDYAAHDLKLLLRDWIDGDAIPR